MVKYITFPEVPIKYYPEILEIIVSSPWASKRLKNRGVTAKCLCGAEFEAGRSIDEFMVKVRNHVETDVNHSVLITEITCTFGLI